MKTTFIPVDYQYFDYEGKNYIQLIGRNDKNEKICIIDSYEPNFWIILKENANEEKLLKEISKIKIIKPTRTSIVEKTEIHNKKFLGKNVRAIKVFVTNHKDAHDIASELGSLPEIDKRREYDISMLTKYIKEKQIEPLNYYSVETEEIQENDFNYIKNKLEIKTILKATSFKKLKEQPKFSPKILAYDIETGGREIGKEPIYMISMYSNNTKKVLTWMPCDSTENYVEFFEDEKEMLEMFSKYTKEEDADIITGYFSDVFDLPYIKERCNKYKIKLDLGLNKNNPMFTKGRLPSGKIFGTVHVDLYKFISAVFSQYLQSETLSLDEVAKELIGSQKEEFDFHKLKNMTESDWKKFFSYNLQDSKVTFELAEKIWPDIFEFTQIIKEPLFDITRDTMATHVENHIIHNLDRFNEIAEKRPTTDESTKRKMKEKFEGALVKEPKPGFYDKIVMFDFTSMHASIIVSFNISKEALSLEKISNSYESPEFEMDGTKTKVYFQKKTGFFSTLLSEIVEKRKQYKKEYSSNKNAMTKARSNAYKLLANATFGYLGFFNARYYSYEASAATLSYVRKFTTDTINTIHKKGFEIIYSDTDSIAFLQENKTKEEIKKFLNELNEKLPGIMELDLEDFYKRGIFVAKRGGTAGAKKKYALLDSDNKIKIRGFETVRRDWCPLTRNLQNEILNKILHEGNEKTALELAKKTIKKLKDRKVEKKDLLIKTQLKREISEYKNPGPQVTAAKKMNKQGIPIQVGMIIEYYIGESKSKLVRDKVFLPEEETKYDIDYYLNSQVLPAIENIFEIFGINVQDYIDGETQKKLF